MQKKLFVASSIIILCGTLFLGVSIFLPEKMLSLRRRISTTLSSLIPHDVTVAKPTKIISMPQIAGATTATSSASPQLLQVPIPPSFARTDFSHYYQTWNNCGPATLSTALTGNGIKINQKDIAAALKPDSDDKNVSADELMQYTEAETDLKTLQRVNGSQDLIKQLVSQRYVVILETWFEPKPNDGMGHFRVITGYDDSKKLFSLSDSYNGPKTTISYEQLEKDWQVYGYSYMVLYKMDTEENLRSLLANDFDEKSNWQNLLSRSDGQLREKQDNPFIWFNRGKAQVHLSQHEEAANSFDVARKIGLPWRMLWYQFEIFDAYLATQQYADIITLTEGNLRQANNLEESWYYKSKALEKQGKTDEAKKALAKVTQFNPHYFEYHPK